MTWLPCTRMTLTPSPRRDPDRSCGPSAACPSANSSRRWHPRSRCRSRSSYRGGRVAGDVDVAVGPKATPVNSSTTAAPKWYPQSVVGVGAYILSPARRRRVDHRVGHRIGHGVTRTVGRDRRSRWASRRQAGRLADKCTPWLQPKSRGATKSATPTGPRNAMGRSLKHRVLFEIRDLRRGWRPGSGRTCSRGLVASTKARDELGYTYGPIEPAIRDAIAYFKQHAML